MAALVKVKRAYEEYSESDGTRVLVDLIWPRGVSKEDAHVDEWCKDIAPTTSLRKWYDHDAEKFDSFKRRYGQELQTKKRTEALEHLQELANNGRLTLITASKAVDISQAVVLAAILNEDS